MRMYADAIICDHHDATGKRDNNPHGATRLPESSRLFREYFGLLNFTHQRITNRSTAHMSTWIITVAALRNKQVKVSNLALWGC